MSFWKCFIGRLRQIVDSSWHWCTTYSIRYYTLVYFTTMCMRVSMIRCVSNTFLTAKHIRIQCICFFLIILSLAFVVLFFEFIQNDTQTMQNGNRKPMWPKWDELNGIPFRRVCNKAMIFDDSSHTHIQAAAAISRMFIRLFRLGSNFNNTDFFWQQQQQ